MGAKTLALPIPLGVREEQNRCGHGTVGRIIMKSAFCKDCHHSRGGICRFLGLHLQPIGLWVGPLSASEAQMPFSPPVGLGPDVHPHLGGRGSPAPSSSPRWPRCGSPSCRLATSPPRCWLHPSLWDGRRKGQRQRSVGRAVLSNSITIHLFVHLVKNLRAVLSAREMVNTADEFPLLQNSTVQ